mmetsp:Transcript_28261/g.55580  ORF Transcript_28261/g.55580 Transcript_28261/m.55580 type:complete len:94 (+) Transcript_28261:1-282(+)
MVTGLRAVGRNACRLLQQRCSHVPRPVCAVVVGSSNRDTLLRARFAPSATALTAAEGSQMQTYQRGQQQLGRARPLSGAPLPLLSNLVFDDDG